MPSSLSDARTALLKYQQAQPHIANDLLTDEPTFHIYVQQKAYLHDEPEGQIPGQEMVTIVNSGTDPIDIPVSTLLQYTNSTRKEWACSLLELAIANNALQLLVVSNEFWKTSTHSSLRGIPIVNTETLLQSISPALVGSQTTFPTHNTTTIEDTTYSILINVDPEPTTVATGTPPQAPDFILACKEIELEPTASSSTSPTTRATRFPATGSATLTPRRAAAVRRWGTRSGRLRRAMRTSRYFFPHVRLMAENKEACVWRVCQLV